MKAGLGITPRQEMSIFIWWGNWKIRLQRGMKRVRPFLFSFLSLVSLVAYFPRHRRILTELPSPRDIQLAVGALIGTILTLGFSLSIIPVQRAAEVYTPTIVRLFRESRNIRYPFLALLSLCLLSFGSVLSPLVAIKPNDTIPILIVFLAIALDLLRELYRSVTLLLEPKEAVWRLEREARERLQQIHRMLERAADLSWRALPAETQGTQTREDYLKVFYLRNPVHDQTVEGRAADLTEIAEKAVERADWTLSFEAIQALGQLAIDSIEIRKTSLTYAPVNLMVVHANTERNLSTVYEDLLGINRTAGRRGAEKVCLAVIRTLGHVAQHMTTVKQDDYHTQFASLAVGPLLHSKMAIGEALAAGFEDAGYTGSSTLFAVANSTPPNTGQDLLFHAVDGIFEILNVLLAAKGKALHTAEPLKRGLEILHVLCARQDSALDRVTRRFLEKLHLLVPVSITLETKQFGELLHLPLAAAYDVGNESSLPNLIRRALVLFQEHPDRPHINPWSRFLELNEGLAIHFRKLANNPGLAASQIMFYLIPALQMIGCVHLRALEREGSWQDYLAHSEEVEKQLAWYLSFFWSSTKNANVLDRTRMEDATKCLGWIGLAALDEGFNSTALSVIRNVASLTKTSAEKIPNVQDRDLATLLMPLRLMSLLASEIGSAHMVKQIEVEEQKVFGGLPQFADLKGVLDHEHQEFRDDLANDQTGFLMRPNDPEDLLIKILRQCARNATSSAAGASSSPIPRSPPA